MVDLSSGNKPLGLKWIFKRNIKADSSIDKYKAKLIVKGFRQKGLDYFDTYSLVIRITSIRDVGCVSYIYSLEIHQINMKIALLNSEL